jgi:hypothetical protein
MYAIRSTHSVTGKGIAKVLETEWNQDAEREQVLGVSLSI